MIPGSVSKLAESTLASATSIAPKTDVVIVTGTTAIQTIVPPLGSQVNQLLVLIPTNAAGVTLGAAGNILVGIAAVQNRAVYLVWSKSLQKWVISSGV